MQVERQKIEHYEYVLRLTPSEAKSLQYLLANDTDVVRKHQGENYQRDREYYAELAAALSRACPDVMGRF